MATQEEIETYLKDSLCFTDDVIATCQKLGVTRSFLSLANLDRMAKVINKDETFKLLPVIDGDHLLWLAKYVRFEKKLPPGDMDALMDLRESWESPGSTAEKNEELIEQLRKELTSDKEKVAKLEEQMESAKKAAMIENAVQSGQICTYQERLKQTEENNAELRKILRRYSKGDKLTKSPFAKLET